MKKLTLKTRIDINNDLIELLRRHDDGSWSYINSESDATLAKKYNCAPAAIGHVRLEMFGKLHKAGNGTPRVESEVFHLKRRFEALLEQLGVKID